MKKVFSGLYARTICHATEDLDKVQQALRTVVGDAEVSVSKTEGHHGNPITILEASVEEHDSIDEFFRRIDGPVLEEVLGSLDCRMDDGCNIFLKLDKQAAFSGEVRMATNDDAVSVRMKVSAFPARPAVAKTMVEEYARVLRT